MHGAADDREGFDTVHWDWTGPEGRDGEAQAKNITRQGEARVRTDSLCGEQYDCGAKGVLMVIIGKKDILGAGLIMGCTRGRHVGHSLSVP